MHYWFCCVRNPWPLLQDTWHSCSSCDMQHVCEYAPLIVQINYTPTWLVTYPLRNLPSMYHMRKTYSKSPDLPFLLSLLSHFLPRPPVPFLQLLHHKMVWPARQATMLHCCFWLFNMQPTNSALLLRLAVLFVHQWVHVNITNAFWA